MTKTVLLHLGTSADTDENGTLGRKLAGLTAGMQVAWKQRLTTPDTLAEIDAQCQRAGISGIVCSNPGYLERLLYAQSDFIPPSSKRGITLDDYQGSLLRTPAGIPVVVINPLENLLTVPYATPAAKRFISKLAGSHNWFQQTRFEWSLGTADTLPALFEKAGRATLCSIDIETPDPCTPDRTINCVGFCFYYADTHTTECVVIPVKDEFHLAWIRKFCNLPCPKVMQNGLYDSLYLLRWRCPVHNWLHDTQHLFHSWYSEFPKRLDFISAFALREIRYWKDDGKSGNLEDYYRYNAKDCWATLNSYLALLAECPDFALRNYVKEFPLVFPAITCELEGIAVDEERFVKVKAEIEQEVNKQEADFQTMIAAPGFNVRSPPQVKNLFKVLGVGHLPDTSKPSMLKAQASSTFNNRILTEVTEIRENKKLLSTYLVPEKFWHGRVYYKLNPAGTDTGRLASAESSFWCGLQIQNMPRGKQIKQFLISDPGWLLCEIDKAQSEARCVGYLSGETALINLVESAHDYHSWNASAFFGVPYESIYDEPNKKTLNKDLRDLSKRTNHGANYNMGPGVMLDTMGPKNVAKAKLMLRLKGSLKDVCKFLLEKYEATYPKVKGIWYDSIVREITETGKLVSPLGWTRVFFGNNFSNKRNLNAAVAHPAQNLSVDIINIEFYDVWRCSIYGAYYRKSQGEIQYDLRGLVRLKAQIHDSIFFQYKGENTPKLVEALMQTRVPIRGADGVTREMLIPSDISAGKSRWSELK